MEPSSHPQRNRLRHGNHRRTKPTKSAQRLHQTPRHHLNYVRRRGGLPPRSPRCHEGRSSTQSGSRCRRISQHGRRQKSTRVRVTPQQRANAHARVRVRRRCNRIPVVHVGPRHEGLNPRSRRKRTRTHRHRRSTKPRSQLPLPRFFETLPRRHYGPVDPHKTRGHATPPLKNRSRYSQ